MFARKKCRDRLGMFNMSKNYKKFVSLQKKYGLWRKWRIQYLKGEASRGAGAQSVTVNPTGLIPARGDDMFT